jgi:hypothetical protein
MQERWGTQCCCFVKKIKKNKKKMVKCNVLHVCKFVLSVEHFFLEKKITELKWLGQR